MKDTIADMKDIQERTGLTVRMSMHDFNAGPMGRVYYANRYLGSLWSDDNYFFMPAPYSFSPVCLKPKDMSREQIILYLVGIKETFDQLYYVAG